LVSLCQCLHFVSHPQKPVTLLFAPLLGMMYTYTVVYRLLCRVDMQMTVACLEYFTPRNHVVIINSEKSCVTFYGAKSRVLSFYVVKSRVDYHAMPPCTTLYRPLLWPMAILALYKTEETKVTLANYAATGANYTSRNRIKAKTRTIPNEKGSARRLPVKTSRAVELIKLIYAGGPPQHLCQSSLSVWISYSSSFLFSLSLFLSFGLRWRWWGGLQ
jgi:hypothetical protein